MNLTDFILDRIAEDEAVAREATVSVLNGEPAEPWEWDHGPGSERDMSPAQDEHHRIWSPWRVLAECEAKRRIVEACSTVSTSCPGWQDGDFTVVRRFVAPHPEDEPHALHILALLALPHAGHPDYREEWKQ